MAYNNRRPPSNGLSSAISLVFAAVAVLGVVGGICWWIYTTVGIVMDGFNHVISVTFSGPSLHWALLLVLALLLAALTRLGYVIMGVWAAIWVCSYPWWGALLLFVPALVLVLLFIFAPIVVLGLIQGFAALIGVLGGRR